MKKNILIILLVISIPALGYFFQSFNTGNDVADASQLKNGQNTIAIANFAFGPATLTVKKNTTISWINNDSTPHQIKADKFSSKILNTGSIFKFKFTKKGTYDYFCALHPSMKGKIIVK